MSEARITAVHSVDMGVVDLAAARKFYTDIWKLSVAKEAGGTVYLRGTGPNYYVVSLRQRPQAELIRVNLLTDSKAAVDALQKKVEGMGLEVIEPAGKLDGPGGGYGFTFKDIEGRNLAVITGVATHKDVADVQGQPRKVSHVVFNSAETEKSIEQFKSLLGFRVSDVTRMMTFLRCNSDHHSVAVTHNTGGPTLHHIAFEVPDWESVMKGAGRCRLNDTPIEWGVGRHGPGNNVFAYFLGPEGYPIEYTAEVQQIDDTYKVGSPNDWGFPPGQSDHWGVTNPPSKRMHEAEGKIRFAKATREMENA